MKGIKKTTDCIRNSQSCKCYADHRFCKRGLEAKTSRGCSHRPFLKGTGIEHIAKRTNNRATRASNIYKSRLFWNCFGVTQLRFLIEGVRSRFSELCFPPKREALSWKKKVRKWVRVKIMKEATWSLHFWCKFASGSGVDSFCCSSLGTG